MKRLLIIGLSIFLFVLTSSISWAQGIDHTKFNDASQCYECHDKVIDKGEFENSKHGNMSCITCHEFQENQKQESITEKCGECHKDAAEDYVLGVHKEEHYGPGCAHCHGSHYITSANGAGSPMHNTNMTDICGSCHSKVEESYKESFHGKAVVLGSEKSPNCTYCHGSHLILNSENPESPASKEKKTELCAGCHEGDVLGVSGVEHYTLEPSGYSAPMYWVKKVFMWLILLVVGFFLIHILLDLVYKLRNRNSRS